VSQLPPDLETDFTNQTRRPPIQSKSNTRSEIQSLLPQQKKGDGDQAMPKPMKNGLALEPLNVPKIPRI